MKFQTMLTLLCILCAATLPAFGIGHVGAIYQYSSIDTLFGLTGDYSGKWGRYAVETDGTFQVGNILEGDLHAAVAFGIRGIELAPFAEVNVIRTFTTGHTIDGGMKLVVPIRNFAIEGGMFLRNSNAFVPMQTGTRNPITGEITWDDPTLLSFSDLGLVNALLKTEFQWYRLKVGLTGIVDVSNQAFHQLITDLSMAWQLDRNLQFSVVAEHIAQAGEGGGQQSKFSGQVGYKFR